MLAVRCRHFKWIFLYVWFGSFFFRDWLCGVNCCSSCLSKNIHRRWERVSVATFLRGFQMETMTGLLIKKPSFGQNRKGFFVLLNIAKACFWQDNTGCITPQVHQNFFFHRDSCPSRMKAELNQNSAVVGFGDTVCCVCLAAERLKGDFAERGFISESSGSHSAFRGSWDTA